MVGTPTDHPGEYPEPGPGPILQREAVPSLPQVAKKRGVQTLVQSLAIDVAVAVALALSILIGPWGGWEDVQWTVLGFVVAKSVVQAVVAWVLRRFVDRSGYGETQS